MDETTIAEMRARATAAKERIDAVEEGDVDEPEFDEVVTAAAMFANDAAKLAEDVDALTGEVERLTKANREQDVERGRVEAAYEKNLHAFIDLREDDASVSRRSAKVIVRVEMLFDERDKLRSEVDRLTKALNVANQPPHVNVASYVRKIEELTQERDLARETRAHVTQDFERLTKAHEERESFWLTEVIEACRLAGVEIPQPRESAIRYIAVAMRSAVGEVDAVRAKVRELEHRLGEAGEQYGIARFEEDKLHSEVERLRASREEARAERDEFGRDVERLTEERAILSAKIASFEPLLEALHCADRQELPRDLADRVTAYVKALPETKDARPQSPRPSVYDEIRAERAAQDAKWGGPQHDDTHKPMEWAVYIAAHTARALGGSILVREETTQCVLTLQCPLVGSPYFRRQMTRVAALAVAAIESYDRARSTAVPSAPAVTS